MPFLLDEPRGGGALKTTHKIKDHSQRDRLKLGKKSRIGEFVIEQLIRVLAFASFAAIILIFVFVFREASPMFFGGSKPHGHAPATTSPTQETYGEPTSTTTNGGAIEQEVYDPLAEEGAKPAATPEAPKSSSPEYTTSTGDGVVEQEVYDPLAEEGKSTTTPTPVAPAPQKDAATLAREQAIKDSLAVEQKKIDQQVADATDIENLLIDTWQPVSQVPKYGLIPLFIGTLKVTLLALLFATPLAVLAALFTSTFAPKWAREIVKPAIELLAGFPSVVIGFFALIVMATVLQDFFGYQFRLNSLVGGIAMSFAVIPIIYTISEDALVSVPKSLKEASDALGATKWQTAWRVVLPAAVPGVFAAVVLGFGRAFGETMIALMATGNAPLTSWNILEPVRTFSATIGAEMAEVVFGDQHYNVLFFIGALLFIFTFSMNMIVEFWVRKRLLRKIQGR